MRLYHGTIHEFDVPNPAVGREAKNTKFDIIICPLADNSLNKWFDQIDNGQIT